MNIGRIMIKHPGDLGVFPSSGKLTLSIKPLETPASSWPTLSRLSALPFIRSLFTLSDLLSRYHFLSGFLQYLPIDTVP